LQWEDFAMGNARRLLDRYRHRLCTFNDDIQGTGAATLAGILAATRIAESELSRQHIAILGAGSAGVGISDQILAGMVRGGLTEPLARSRLWLIDINGLLTDSRTDLEPFQRGYAQPMANLSGWNLERPGRISLFDVVGNVRPSVLIGASAQSGAFDERLVRM